MTLLKKEEVIEMTQENGVIDWDNFRTKLIVSIYENCATSKKQTLCCIAGTLLRNAKDRSEVDKEPHCRAFGVFFKNQCGRHTFRE